MPPHPAYVQTASGSASHFPATVHFPAMHTRPVCDRLSPDKSTTPLTLPSSSLTGKPRINHSRPSGVRISASEDSSASSASLRSTGILVTRPVLILVCFYAEMSLATARMHCSLSISRRRSVIRTGVSLPSLHSMCVSKSRISPPVSITRHISLHLSGSSQQSRSVVLLPTTSVRRYPLNRSNSSLTSRRMPSLTRVRETASGNKRKMPA